MLVGQHADGLLTGEGMAELAQVFLWIDEHGGRLGGKHQCVFGCNAAAGRLSDALALYDPEVGFTDRVVEDETIASVARHQAAAWGLACIDGPKRLAVGSKFYGQHTCKGNKKLRV